MFIIYSDFQMLTYVQAKLIYWASTLTQPGHKNFRMYQIYQWNRF